MLGIQRQERLRLALNGLQPVVNPWASCLPAGYRTLGGWNELHPLLGSAWSRQPLWNLLTPRFSSSQPPESPRWTWAFIDCLLVLGKHPRLPVDRAGRGCFFTVGNDFILKTPPPHPTPLHTRLPPFSLAAWNWSRHLPRPQEALPHPLGWPA